MAHAERLSALDAAFLALETGNVSFTVGSVLRFDHHLDLDELRAYVDAALDRLPRYRQKVGRLPLLRHPVWVDDDCFAIERHVRPAPRPAPGAPWPADEVDQVAAELVTRGVPTEQPPWQLWLVEVEGDRSAIVALFHHALVDGLAGVHLLEHLLRPTPDRSMPDRVAPAAERAPTRGRLLAAELRHRAAGLRRLGGSLSKRRPRVVRALAALLRQALDPASDIGINPAQSGRDRAIATLTVDLDSLKRCRASLGVTLNDLVLAMVAGALRRLMVRRGVDPDRSHDIRAMVPVASWRPTDAAVSGNRVVLLLAPLPVDEPDAARRLERIASSTRMLKERSGQRSAGELLVQLSDATVPSLLGAVLRLALSRRAFNLVVTNIPGPPAALYLLGARLDAITPIVNLWPHNGIGIAVLTYAGVLHVGIHADRAVIADLRPFVRDLAESLAEIMAIAGAARTARPAPPPPEATDRPAPPAAH